MFIQTNGKEEILQTLKTEKENEVIIHYHCSQCEDEQVTDAIEIDEEMVEMFKKDGHLMIGYPCTNEHCGTYTRFISEESIFGFEK